MIRKMMSSLSSSDFPELWTVLLLLLLLGPFLLQGLCKEKKTKSEALNKKKKEERESSTHSGRNSLYTVDGYFLARGPTEVTVSG